jgi:hypothetical protein
MNPAWGPQPCLWKARSPADPAGIQAGIHQVLGAFTPGYRSRTIRTNALPNEPVPPVIRIDLTWAQLRFVVVIKGLGVFHPKNNIRLFLAGHET